MKTLIVFDSVNGNTEKIARAIAHGLGGKNQIMIERAGEALVYDLKSIDLLIVGSPTYGGRPTEPVQHFLKNLPAGSLKNIKITAFDTRFDVKTQKLALQLLMGVIGYAAPKIAKTLQEKGGILISPPEGFIVEGTKGPLREGEEARAENWGKEMLDKLPYN